MLFSLRENKISAIIVKIIEVLHDSLFPKTSFPNTVPFTFPLLLTHRPGYTKPTSNCSTARGLVPPDPSPPSKTFDPGGMGYVVSKHKHSLYALF